jgi:hypothetical protein
MASKLFIFLFSVSYCFNSIIGQSYEVKIKVKSLPNDTLIIANHYADKQYVADTLFTDKKGNAIFKGSEKTKAGLYLLMFPSKKYLEFVLNEPAFSLETDTTDFVERTKFEGSKENEVMYQDLKYISSHKARTDTLVKWRDACDKSDPKYNKYVDELQEIQDKINANRKSIIKNNPNLLFTSLLKFLFEPIPPSKDQNMSDEEYNEFVLDFMHTHFWDDIDINDSRLLRTPILYRSLEKYLDHYCYQDPDSLIKYCDELIERTKNSEENHKYMLSYTLNKYANSKLMGQDAIYVHIADEYYAKGKTPWVDSTNLYKIVNGAKRMRNSLIGKKAKNIILSDSSGVMHNMYNSNTDYTLLWFWDPDCGHCKKATPKLIAAWDTLSTLYNMTGYSICTEPERDKWVKYLKEHTNPFINLADFNYRSNFREDYDISGTPRLFILDKNKNIIAKKIGPEHAVKFMENYLKLEEKKKQKLVDKGQKIPIIETPK